MPQFRVRNIASAVVYFVNYPIIVPVSKRQHLPLLASISIFFSFVYEKYVFSFSLSLLRLSAVVLDFQLPSCVCDISMATASDVKLNG